MVESSYRRTNQGKGNLKAARRAFENGQDKKGLEELAHATTNFSLALKFAKRNPTERKRILVEAHNSLLMVEEIVGRKYPEGSEVYNAVVQHRINYQEALTRSPYKSLTAGLIGVSVLSLAASFIGHQTGGVIGTEYVSKNLPIIIALISSLTALFFNLKK